MNKNFCNYSATTIIYQQAVNMKRFWRFIRQNLYNITSGRPWALCKADKRRM